MEGVDDIGLTLQKNNKIDIHEEKIHNIQDRSLSVQNQLTLMIKLAKLLI